MSPRKTISLTALLSFVLLTLTSVILYIEPAGRVAYWSGWRLWGLTKENWSAVHINVGVLFFVAVALHAFYNGKAITTYLKTRARKLRVFTPDFNLSLVLTLAVVAGTLAGIPPWSTIIDAGTAISDRANLKYGEPPYGHAELSPLAVFADRVKIDLEQAVEALKQAGIRVEDPKQTMEQIARANGMVPRDIYAAMAPEAARTTPGSEMPEQPPGGTGNRTLATLCGMYALDIGEVVGGLAASGITASPDMTMKRVASANGLDPHGVYAVLYRLSRDQAEVTVE